MTTDFQDFIGSLIESLRSAPVFQNRVSFEEYDGRYETEQPLKIAGDETVCYVGLEDIEPSPIPQVQPDESVFNASLTVVLFVEVRRTDGFSDENKGAKTVPFDVAMEVFQYLYNNPVRIDLDYVFPHTAKENEFRVMTFSGFSNILRLTSVVVVGGTISYPIRIKTELI